MSLSTARRYVVRSLLVVASVYLLFVGLTTWTPYPGYQQLRRGELLPVSELASLRTQAMQGDAKSLGFLLTYYHAIDPDPEQEGSLLEQPRLVTAQAKFLFFFREYPTCRSLPAADWVSAQSARHPEYAEDLQDTARLLAARDAPDCTGAAMERVAVWISRFEAVNQAPSKSQ